MYAPVSPEASQITRIGKYDRFTPDSCRPPAHSVDLAYSTQGASIG